MSLPNATAAGIGATLRNAREALGASVEEAAWRTRIRPEYLRALEDERFDACGHLAHGRAHLHSYARFLGLDAQALVRDYVEHVEHAEPSSIEQLHERVKEERKPQKPNWLIAAIIAALVLIGASVAGLVRGPGPKTEHTGSTLPKLPQTSQPSSPASAPAVVPPGSTAKGVTLVVVAQTRSWIKASANGLLLFEGIIAAGESKTFTGVETIDITVGNAGAVRLILNGRDLGPPGKSGQVYRARLGPQGPVPAK
jgi:cytoskeletal protein RodZ